MKSLGRSPLIFSLTFALLAGCAPPSDFEGIWAGRMIQPDGPRGLDGYTQFLQLEVQDTRVYGMSRIEIPDSSFYGDMSVEGSIRGDTLFLTETAIISQHARDGHFWCLKQASLILDRERMTLSGAWVPNGIDCAPGRIDVHRIFQ